MTSLKSFACVAAATLGLASCAGLETLTSAATPVELYALTPKSTFASGLPRLRQQIVVEEPTASAAVASDRITVQPSALRVQYLPEARWVDRAPAIIQTLLIESYENTGKVDAVGRSAVGLRADYLIITDLREFQARLPAADEPDAPLEVLVRLNMKVVDSFEDRIIASRSFQELAPAEGDDPDMVVLAFDEALGAVLKDSISWSIREMHGHSG
ncbi:MAG: ABC-type transport auxiliary lipoprotein family protein [Pseudomonadota bacterium]